LTDLKEPLSKPQKKSLVWTCLAFQFDSSRTDGQNLHGSCLFGSRECFSAAKKGKLAIN